MSTFSKFLTLRVPFLSVCHPSSRK